MANKNEDNNNIRMYQEATISGCLLQIVAWLMVRPVAKGEACQVVGSSTHQRRMTPRPSRYVAASRMFLFASPLTKHPQTEKLQ